MSLSDKILELLDNPSMPVSPDWVREMARTHPAFILPASLLVSRNPGDVDDDELREIKLRLLLSVSDPTALGDMVDIAGGDWANLYPREKTADRPSTDSAISTFLDAYGSSDDSETSLLEQLIFNPAPADYFSEEEIASCSESDSLLPPELRRPASAPASETEVTTGSDDKPATNVTIQETPLPDFGSDFGDTSAEMAAPEKKAPQKGDDSLLSESLAKIFIKQRRYERAYEIISNLSLNFPEKSVYFADQLRFLQKLIKIQQQQQQNK